MSLQNWCWVLLFALNIRLPLTEIFPIQSNFINVNLKAITNYIFLYQKATHLALVVLRVDNAIHWINHYSVASVVCFANTYLLDSDFSTG